MMKRQKERVSKVIFCVILPLTTQYSSYIRIYLSYMYLYGNYVWYLTRKMTIDRNTIVTLHKQGYGNSSIARSYIFAVKRFARW